MRNTLSQIFNFDVAGATANFMDGFSKGPNWFESLAPRVGFEPKACRLTGEGCFQHFARREDNGLQDRCSRSVACSGPSGSNWSPKLGLFAPISGVSLV